MREFYEKKVIKAARALDVALSYGRLTGVDVKSERDALAAMRDAIVLTILGEATHVERRVMRRMREALKRAPRKERKARKGGKAVS